MWLSECVSSDSESESFKLRAASGLDRHRVGHGGHCNYGACIKGCKANPELE